MAFKQTFNSKDVNVVNATGQISKLHLGTVYNDGSKSVLIKDVKDSKLGNTGNVTSQETSTIVHNPPKQWICRNCSKSSRYLCLECLEPLCSTCTKAHENKFHSKDESSCCSSDEDSSSEESAESAES